MARAAKNASRALKSKGSRYGNLIVKAPVSLTTERLRSTRGILPYVSYVVVETSNTAVTCGHDHFCHRQRRLINKLLRELKTAGLRYCARGCAKMLMKKTAQVPIGDAQPVTQLRDTLVIQCPG